MKILYLTNYPSPYRVTFFNQLAEKIDLDVMYEGLATCERDKSWMGSVSVEHAHYEVDCGEGTSVVKPTFQFLKRVLDKNYDLVVVGCYNSLCGVAAIAALKAFRRRFAINVDGEYFGSTGLGKKMRDAIVKGANGYLVAGERTGGLLKELVGAHCVFPYHFSSLTEAELVSNAKSSWNPGGELLCVGQYADYKGIDVLVDAMKYLENESLVIVGASDRLSELETYVAASGATNIRNIPFLGKKSLGKLYRTCNALILPSRQECWGLVINEAASFGAPIVSTRGAGAALEFLDKKYARYLAEPGDPISLASSIRSLVEAPLQVQEEYSRNLLATSRNYSIEAMVGEHVGAFETIVNDERF